MLAIYLNRTIVLPPFFKHKTDPSSRLRGYLYQNPTEKIDAENLASFMPTITLQEYQNQCNGDGLDVAYLARLYSNVSQVGRVQTYEKILKFPMVNKPIRGNKRLIMAPTVSNSKTYLKKKREESYIHLSKKDAEIAYGPEYNINSNDGKCALWIEPYRNMIFQWAVEKWSQGKDKNGKIYEFQEPDEIDSVIDRPEELTVRMIAATKRPKSVRNAASDFHKEFMNGKTYLAMHWRYDPTDFFENLFFSRFFAFFNVFKNPFY